MSRPVIRCQVSSDVHCLDSDAYLASVCWPESHGYLDRCNASTVCQIDNAKVHAMQEQLPLFLSGRLCIYYFSLKFVSIFSTVSTKLYCMKYEVHSEVVIVL